MKTENKSRGFTLTELICVMAIMMILAAVLVPACLGFVEQARKARLMTEINSLKTAVHAYVLDVYLGDEPDGFLLMEEISEIPVTSQDNPLHEYFTEIPSEELIISEITLDRSRMTAREMVVRSADYYIIISGDETELIPR